MTQLQALQAISQGVWLRPTRWEHTRGDAVETPKWTVYDQVGQGWVTREIGWYKQEGGFDNYEGLVKLARAMDAADKALMAAL